MSHDTPLVHQFHSASSTSMSSRILWHFKLGCLSSPRLAILTVKDSLIKLDHCIPCDYCHYEKEKRLSFPLSKSISARCFELIHVDNWGPMSTITHTNHNYFLTIVDYLVVVHGSFCFLISQKPDCICNISLLLFKYNLMYLLKQ